MHVGFIHASLNSEPKDIFANFKVLMDADGFLQDHKVQRKRSSEVGSKRAFISILRNMHRYLEVELNGFSLDEIRKALN